ncbi:MAG: BON domain-containing protein [Phycisphaeraceae bacterium]
MKMIALTLAGVIGLLGISGCEPTDEQTSPRPTPEPTEPGQPMPDEQQQPQPGQEQTEPGQEQQPGQEPLGREREDQQLAQEVRDRIEQEAQLEPNGRQITVSVDQGEVTLSGNVQSEQESQQIEQIAADVVGPDNVQNELQVSDQAQQQPGQQQPGDQPEQQQP